MSKPDPERIAKLSDRAQRLGQLKEHPSWSELRQVFEARRRKHFDSLARQLIAGVAVDQRYIDRMAGFFKGAEFILDHPDLAETSLQRALEKVERMQTYEQEVIA